MCAAGNATLDRDVRAHEHGVDGRGNISGLGWTVDAKVNTLEAVEAWWIPSPLKMDIDRRACDVRRGIVIWVPDELHNKACPTHAQDRDPDAAAACI